MLLSEVPCPLAATRFWPYTGSLVAAGGHFLVATNRRALLAIVRMRRGLVIGQVFAKDSQPSKCFAGALRERRLSLGNCRTMSEQLGVSQVLCELVVAVH